MRVLLITASAFAPWNVIGAIRWSKICKYLADEEIHIDVVAHKKNIVAYDDTLMNDVSVCDKIVYLEENALEHMVCRMFRFLNKLKGKIYFDEEFSVALLTNKWTRLINYYGFARECRSYFKKTDDCYDIVISTNPLSAHWGANIAAHKYRIPWIADFRDPIAANDNTWYGHWISGWQKKICERADAIIAVSKGLNEVLCRQRKDLMAKTVTIYNGFDPDDFQTGALNSDDKIHLVYTGILYAGKRDLSPVFETLYNLTQAGIIRKEELVFDYAGREYKILSEQAAKYQMQDIIVNHGFVTRLESLALQGNADILVMATYNDEGNPGVMPGKLYEYMMMHKPILAVVSGEVRDSELKSVINECDVGLCHETKFDDITKMQDFIQMIAESHRIDKPIQLAYQVERFDYRNIAGQVKKLICDTLEQGKNNEK